MTKTEALERSSVVDENGNHMKWAALDGAWPTPDKVSKTRRQFALLNKKFAVSAEPTRASAGGAALKRYPKTDMCVSASTMPLTNPRKLQREAAHCASNTRK